MAQPQSEFQQPYSSSVRRGLFRRAAADKTGSLVHDESLAHRVVAEPVRSVVGGANPLLSADPYVAFIVGGGPSAVLITSSLIREYEQTFKNINLNNRPRLHIIVMNKTGQRIGRGNIYPRHLSTLDVNQLPEQMSLKIDEPNHCERLLREKGDSVDAKSAIPRALYGKYCEEAFGELINNSPIGVTVIPLPGTVYNVQGTIGHFRVITGPSGAEGGDSMRADQVFLAIGHIHHAPEDYKGTCFTLADQKSMECARDVVTKLPAYKNPSEQNAVIIGYGPTAVDCLRLLDQWGYKGNIMIINRHHPMKVWANRPEWMQRQIDNPYQLTLKNEQVEELALLYQQAKESEAQGKFVELIQREIEAAEAKRYNGSAVVYSQQLADMISSNKVMRISPDFAREANDVIRRFRGAQTLPDDAALIQRYERSYPTRLKIIPGYAEFPPIAEEGKKEVTVRYTDLGSNEIQSIPADIVFDGAPYRTDYRIQGSLLARVCDNGLGRFGRQTGKFHCNHNAESHGCSGLFSVGPHTKLNGTEIENWGIQSFAEQASRAAGRFIEHMTTAYFGRPVYGIDTDSQNRDGQPRVRPAEEATLD